MRGRNPEFLVGGIKAIFKKNWMIDVSETEIDSSLSYRENFHILMDRYVKLSYSHEEIESL